MGCGQSFGAETAEVGGLVFGDEDENVERLGEETEGRAGQGEEEKFH